jgi:kynurenine formamidase
MAYEITFLKALLLTISIETTVLLFATKLILKTDKVSKWILLLTGILATFATLPYLWFILPVFIKAKIWYVIASEVSAIGIESIIIFGVLRTKYRKALLISVLCNTTSFLIGLLFTW